MILKAEVLSVEQQGDSIKLKLQAKKQGQSEWRSWLSWSIELPEYAGRTYRCGDSVHLVVKRKAAGR